MLASVTRLVRLRQLGPPQRWISASSARKQLDFPSTGKDTVEDDAEFRPEKRTKGRDAREDPTYEQWLDTIGKQYQRSDRRNWLGGSVVRQYFHRYVFVSQLTSVLVAISVEPLLQTPHTSLRRTATAYL